MDALRVSLLIIGVAIVIAIYVIGRRHLNAEDRRLQIIPSVHWSELFLKIRPLFRLPKFNIPKISFPNWRSESAATTPPVNEVLDSEDIESLNHIVTDRTATDVDVDDISLIVELTTEQIAPAGEQLFIPITIIGHAGHRFTGEAIMDATEQLDIRLSDDGVFRLAVEDNHGYEQPLLGLANIMEPGTFELSKIQNFETPGLVLYLHLPGPIEAREAFEKLIETGRALAELLEGDLCDETRSVLTNQTISHLKEKVEAYRFKQKMALIKQRRP